MRLLEHEAKRLLRDVGIPVPEGRLARSEAELAESLEHVQPPVVLKAQIPAGGRQKAGGIVFPRDKAEARRKGGRLLTATLRGYPVEGILVETKGDVDREFFLAITYDTAEKLPVILLSTQGGVDVEEMARRGRGEVVRVGFDPRREFLDYEARDLARRVGLRGPGLLPLAAIIAGAVHLFLERDATLVEINPLGRRADGGYLALDAHIEIDDDALYRQADLEKRYGIPRREGSGKAPTPFERRAAEIDGLDHRGVAGRVIEFDGDLGLLIGGGGASLAIFDAVRRHGGRPANYCEIGGNPSVRKVAELTKLILSRPGVRRLAVIMNVVSNTRVDLVGRGVIRGVIEAGREPAEAIAVFRVPGSWEEEGIKILRRYGIPFCDRTVSIDEAARRAVCVP